MNVFIIYLSGLSLATQRGPYYETKNPIRQLDNAETDTFLDSLISLVNALGRPDRRPYKGQVISTGTIDKYTFAGGVGKRDQFPEEDQGDVVRAVGDTEFPSDASRTHSRRSSSGESRALNLKSISQEAPLSYTENNPFIFSHIIERKRRFAAPSHSVSPGGDTRQL